MIPFARIFSVNNIDNTRFYGKISSICKDYAEINQPKGSEREGNGESPYPESCVPLPASPGMTGTGAPVTERLRYPVWDELGWYRDYTRPYFLGASYFFVFNYGGYSYESETLWRKRIARNVSELL